MADDAKTPCVIYAAKSTQDRHKSIPTQIEDCREMAEREGWEVFSDPKRFKDEGFSAYSGNRGPGLERAKRAAAAAAAERGTTAVLLVQHSDRLARGAGDRPGAADSLVEIWHQMRRADVHIRSVQNDAMLSDPLLVAAASKLAFEESERKSKAIKSGKRRRVEERGQTNGPLSFGYRFENPDAKVRVRVPDPDEAAAWLRMRELLSEGKALGEIARWVNSHGFRSKRGKVFSAQRVRDLLANPYYAGKVRFPDSGELAEGAHEALVSWDEHQQIVKELNALWKPAKTRPGRRPIETTLLSGGLMRCAHCGRGIWQRKHDSGRRDYLCGSVRQKTGSCVAAPFDAPTVERAVLAHLDGLFVDLGGWIDRLSAEREDGRRAVESEAAALMREREALGKDEALVRGDYLRQLRAGNDGAAAVAAAEVERIERERAELDASLADVDARLGEWDGADDSDSVLDWWTAFSEAIREDVVGARTVAEANAALKERFAAIFVRSPEGGSPRLDFVLAERAPGAPLVSSRLWADAEVPDDGSTLIDFMSTEESEDPTGNNGDLTFVWL
ncbi:MAG TPA: recombinase family protein [Solirubrobacterales bacterium]|nr:recombinase family protein [Solirubrobacterales bacterium]